MCDATVVTLYTVHPVRSEIKIEWRSTTILKIRDVSTLLSDTKKNAWRYQNSRSVKVALKATAKDLNLVLCRRRSHSEFIYFCICFFDMWRSCIAWVQGNTSIASFGQLFLYTCMGNTKRVHALLSIIISTCDADRETGHPVYIELLIGQDIQKAKMRLQSAPTARLPAYTPRTWSRSRRGMVHAWWWPEDSTYAFYSLFLFLEANMVWSWQHP